MKIVEYSVKAKTLDYLKDGLSYREPAKYYR